MLTGVAVGLVWGILDGLATWEHSELFLRAGDVLIIVSSGMACGALLSGTAATVAGLVPRLRAPLPAGAAGLAALTVVLGISRLVREPVIGRDTMPLPGGVAVAVAVALAVGILPLVAVAVLHRRRQPVALALWKVWAVALVLATWFTPWSGRGRSAPTAAAPGAPNLVLITLDTFRADHVGALGAEGDPTPNLDALAARGVLFERAYSQIPVTGPSHASILSGRYPWTHETLANGVAMPDQVPLLSEMLGRRGYLTAAFVSAFVLDGVFGYDRGFQVYDDAFHEPKGVSDLSPLRAWEQYRVRTGEIAEVERRGDHTVDEALDWLDTVGGDQPFFLWVHLFDAHGPYAPPPPYDALYYDGDPRDPSHTSMQRATGVASYMRASLAGITDLAWPVAQYRGEVTFVDAQLGRLVEGLDRREGPGETIVVVVGDHGESLTEHDYYFNHGARLYTPSTHVPLVIVAPGALPAGRRVSPVVENVDLLPTLLHLLGLEPLDDLPGEDLVPLCQHDGAPATDQALTVTFDRDANRETGERMRYRMIGIRGSGYSFIYRERGDEELYLLSEDPGETENRAGLASDLYLVQDLTAHAEQILESAGTGAFERAAGELGAGTEERLKALGYVEEDGAR